MLRLLPVLLLGVLATPSASQTTSRMTAEEAVFGLLQGDATPAEGDGWRIVDEGVVTLPRQAAVVAGEDAESVPRTMLIHDGLRSFAGSLTVEGERELVVLSPAAALSLVSTTIGGSSTQRVANNGTSASGAGDVMKISWWSENEPFYSCRRVTVQLERRPGQSQAEFREEFQEMVSTAMGFYPPNSCGPDGGMSAGIVMNGGKLAQMARGSLPWKEMSSPAEEVTSLPIVSGPPIPDDEDVMSISWKHDPDGNGPLQPVDVTCSTERRSGESSSTTARRLGKMAKELMKVFPPNAPTTPSSGTGSGSGGGSGG